MPVTTRRGRSPARTLTTSPSRKRSVSRGRRSSASPQKDNGFFTLRVLHVVLSVIGGVSLWRIRAHTQLYGFNWLQAILAVFLVLNVFICFCEINLFLRADFIYERFRQYEREYRGREYAVAVDWFLMPLTPGTMLSDAWCSMWSAYALFDPSYATDTSHGFWVDSGNGVLTLLPSLLLLHGMTSDSLLCEWLTPRWLGALSLVIFWTEFFGTVMYLWGFMYHKRYQVIGWKSTVTFVGLSNGIWFVVPLMGMCASLVMIETDSMDIFRQ